MTKVRTRAQKDRKNELAKLRRAKDPKRARERERANEIRWKELGYSRNWSLQKRYGIGIREFDAIVVSQHGRCPCCGRMLDRSRPRAVHVDHDHVTGAIRGIVCAPCNTAIGRLGDNAAGVQRALDYLQRPTETVDEHW